MPESADLYEVLQVHPSARPEVIDAVYRQLAHIYHPDRNPAPDAEERMKKINLAHEVLSNPQKRADYDRQRAGSESNWTGGASVDDVIRAKSFRLVNDAGRTRAELSLDEAGNPMLVMNDRSGSCRFELFQRRSGRQQLVIYDQNGNTRLVVGESRNGRPVLYTTDSNGKRRFAIHQDKDGSQKLILFDEDGYSVVAIDEGSQIG